MKHTEFFAKFYMGRSSCGILGHKSKEKIPEYFMNAALPCEHYDVLPTSGSTYGKWFNGTRIPENTVWSTIAKYFDEDAFIDKVSEDLNDAVLRQIMRDFLITLREDETPDKRLFAFALAKQFLTIAKGCGEGDDVVKDLYKPDAYILSFPEYVEKTQNKYEKTETPFSDGEERMLEEVYVCNVLSSRLGTTRNRHTERFIADELRGAVDGWDFKSYVLGTMFYRYISENLTAYINKGEHEAGNAQFDYARMSDAEAEEAREGLVEEKGFFILPSELFCNVRARALTDENLNETLERVFRNIEESAQGSQSENSFAGLFDDFDVNSNKLGSTVAKRNERLVKLLDGVASMKLGSVQDHEIDAFGDAYEYLMTMYASNAGKSGGEFFTPADVSELLTRLGTAGKKKINKVYEM